MCTAAGDDLVGVVARRPVGSPRMVLVVENLNDALLHLGAGPFVFETDREGVAHADHSTYAASGAREIRSSVAVVLNTWGVGDATYEALRDRTRGLLERLFPRDGPD